MRSLRRRPGFTTVGIVTLALGIGANTAVFSVVQAVLLRSLPYPNPSELVQISESYGTDSAPIPASFPNLRDWQRESRSFAEVAAYRVLAFQWILTGRGEPRRLRVVPATANLFPLLGVRAALGRTFVPREDLPGAPPVMLLSHEAWQTHFGGEQGIIGQAITLAERSYTIAGVLPASFQLLDSVDVWLPIGQMTNGEIEQRVYHPFVTLARLRPGISVPEAQAEMTAISAALARQYPVTGRGWSARVTSFQEVVVGKVRPALVTLLVAVGLVLLLACVNLASLLTARASARRQEMAVRVALGASRWRLIQQGLAESTLLSIAGGAAGCLLALLGLRLLELFGPADLPRRGEIALDSTVLLFAAALSIATGFLCGILPAWKSSGSAPGDSIRSAGRSITERWHRWREGLAGAELALALVLLVSAGLLSKSFVRLLAVDPGFRPEGLLAVQLALPESKMSDPQGALAFVRRLESTVGALPGVERFSVTTTLPFQTDATQRMRFAPEGFTPLPGESWPVAEGRFPSVAYFATLSIPLREGRWFEERDYKNPVLIVNESLARRFWPRQNPIGKRVNISPIVSPPQWLTVVGVVGDVKQYGLDTAATLDLYVSTPWPRFLVVRTTGDPLTLATSIRQAVRAAEPAAAVASVSTMEGMMNRSLGRRKFVMLLVDIFSASALLLAAIGIYGVMSLTVTDRTREMGIRLALGAPARTVLRLVLGRGLRVALLGWAAGIGISLVAVQILRSQLFQVTRYDPAVLAGISVLLIAVAAVACYVPARRAMRVDPLVALRED